MFAFFRHNESVVMYVANLVLFIPIILSGFRVMKNKLGEEPLLNKELKALSLGSALLAVGLFTASFFI
ncbi:hypothetical protein QQ054_23820 [Oscillatoria amoena NRMC-F 0135]|nr:hypothetical protein [Oscillatoria amoena NRMC-F 0135]